MSVFASTPGQTVGPFFGYALPYRGGESLVPPTHPDSVRLHGTVYDGVGEPVQDALVEVWQPDPTGAVVQQAGSLVRDGWTFTGWGRAATDRTGTYSFSTLRPGPAGPGATPYFCLVVFARGLTDRLFTRAYLPSVDGTELSDALLDSLEPRRRATLVSIPDPGGFRFDIRLQGDAETVFLKYGGH